VYKYSASPVPAEPRHVGPPTRFLRSNEPADEERPVRIPLTVPEGAGHLTVDVWDRFGGHARHLADETSPETGSRAVEREVNDDDGQALAAGSYILRVTVDGSSESRILRVRQ